MKAPELPSELQWLNTTEPLSLKKLRGKVIILDFWTYCCINCIHVLPDLHYLEQKYQDQLVVIGIHSPKFPNEKVNQHVLQAITRYDIQHPVANDPSFSVWQQYSVRAWPTLVVIDTEGSIAGVYAGEGHRQALNNLIALCLAKAKQHSNVAVTIMNKPVNSLLAFPGKVYVSGQSIYISDTGHHRIIEASVDGKIKRIFGSGKADLVDGQQAAFHFPQGITADNEYVYIADTGNHAIRRINRITGEVGTLAGTGQQAVLGRFVNEDHCALNSPWDITLADNILFIAMAGSHQIWLMNLQTRRIGILAGSGLEHIIDGESAQAAFAQPSGITIGGSYLYIADSETSAIREINLATGITHTLMGEGLFDFGDKDGLAKEGRLQHPLGVSYDRIRHCVWIADSYNHKLKCLDLATQMIASISLATMLAEPGGCYYDHDVVWIADTNQHRIIKYSVLDQSSTEFKMIE